MKISNPQKYSVSLLYQNNTEKSVFTMNCFWSGEGALGNIDGVIATKPGFLHGHEVVEVEFDPTIVSYEELVQQAISKRVDSRIFTRNDDQQKIATEIDGQTAQTSQQKIRTDHQHKYYLSHTPLKYVPMTGLQASRVNAAIGHRQNFQRLFLPDRRPYWIPFNNTLMLGGQMALEQRI